MTKWQLRSGVSPFTEIKLKSIKRSALVSLSEVLMVWLELLPRRSLWKPPGCSSNAPRFWSAAAFEVKRGQQPLAGPSHHLPMLAQMCPEWGRRSLFPMRSLRWWCRDSLVAPPCRNHWIFASTLLQMFNVRRSLDLLNSPRKHLFKWMWEIISVFTEFFCLLGFDTHQGVNQTN